MRVRLETSISGTRDGADWPARGGVIDLPNAEAVALIGAGIASAVAVRAAVETATAPDAPETAAVISKPRRKS